MRHPHRSPASYDLVTIGAGPAGLACGLAAAQLGLNAVVVGPRSNPNDGRTAALFQPAVELLRNIGVWRDLAGSVEPLKAIRIVDAAGSIFRAPEVTFEARELGLEAFGYNVPNAALTGALERAAAGRIRRIKIIADAIEISGDLVTVSCGDEDPITTEVVCAADGRASPTRTAAGIETTAWAYDQTAIVATFAHSRDHNGVSTEFHRRSGPLTVVPCPSRTSSLVWVETPEAAQKLLALDDIAFANALRAIVGGLLGSISGLSPRRQFPLSGLTATVMAKNRVALIGEAAHVMPPIGAQGLNLSLRDAATLATLAAEAKANGGDTGSSVLLARYASMRRADVRSRSIGVDLMNRSLLSGALPIHLARGFGLFALATAGPLRRFAMREGLAPASDLPAIMRPTALTAQPISTAGLDAAAPRRA